MTPRVLSHGICKIVQLTLHVSDKNVDYDKGTCHFGSSLVNFSFYVETIQNISRVVDHTSTYM